MQKTSSRLLSLLSLLQTRRDWSGEDLAGRLDITSRTVRRDIDRLRGLGYPITTVKGPAGGYRLEAGTHMPPLLFDDDQVVALTVALRTAAAGTAVAEDASRALATLRQVMPPRLRHRIDLLRVTAVPPPAAGDTLQVEAHVLMELSRAVHAREELRFDYAPGRGAPAGNPRRVQPHHLVTWRQRWYLVAWDLHREDWRTFRAERIRPRIPTGPRFAPRELPGGNISTFITSRFRGNDGTTTGWPCQGEVILHLPAADVAPFAQDGVVEELGPHHCRLVLGSWSWTGLATAIGRFDTAIDVIGPPQLATAFGDLATRYTHAARATRPGTGPTR
ncbi:YafY family protein [Streptomyces sp. NP-1717]|uniref:helix-turn-helix transcriptional regulator n=1 Tax=Streptomyces sp. NP-1717 TaxID=2704470 RepID=UPI001F5DA6B9|nr:WYL domain-containing protein [Streptomyces sp. NP-1717]MCI3220764.1 WYL domain-containing protein [Streptomyces sp. NP-1717]